MTLDIRDCDEALDEDEVALFWFPPPMAVPKATPPAPGFFLDALTERGRGIRVLAPPGMKT